MKREAFQRLLPRKVALITGGNRGIGLAITRALMAEGCDVIISARDESTLRRAAKEIGGNRAKAVPLVCDLRDPACVVFAAIKDRRLDILVNNAGITHANLGVANLPVESWEEVIATNLAGMFLVTSAALPLMSKGRGHRQQSLYCREESVSGFFSLQRLQTWRARVHQHPAGRTPRTGHSRNRPVTGGDGYGGVEHALAGCARGKMMSASTVAQAVVCALTLPPESTPEELQILPRAGAL